jgi:23S rRNA (adenine-N6)-dimethyltransferase
VRGPPRAAPNPAGAHFLRNRTLITRLVGASGAGNGDLVLDLGAGYGAITAALATAGPRVIAVERDHRLVRKLDRRFAGEPRVRVVAADVLRVPLPRGEFLVVASIPFGVTTELLRRLLGDPGVPLAGAELIVGGGAARWLASPRPRDAETAWWTARYRIRLARPIPATSFAPAPNCDAAQISIRPRPIAGSRGDQRMLRGLLRDAFRGGGHRPVNVSRRVLLRAGIAPERRAADLTADEWHRLACLLAARPGPAGSRSPGPTEGVSRR